MIVHYSAEEGAALLQPDDFRNFKVQLKGLVAIRPDIEGIAFVDDDNALVAMDLVTELAKGRDAKWRAAFDHMIVAARKHGWIDEATGSIRAHVERTD